MNRRSRWVRSGLGITVALTVLALIEVGLRTRLGPPPPPVQVYQALGPHDAWFEARDDAYWPTYPPNAVPLPAESPVVVLGGSSVHGGTPGLDRSGEFPAVAGALLDIQVTNLGAPGLDSHDHVEILTALQSLPANAPRPEVVVVYTGHNDFGNARFQARYGTVSAGVAAHLQAALEHFQLYAQLSRTLRPVRGRSREVGVSRTQPSLTPEAWAAALRHLLRNLDRLVHLTAEAGQSLVLMAPMSDLVTPPVDRTCLPERCPSRDHRTAAQLGKTDPEGAAQLLRHARDTDFAAPRSPTTVGEAMVRLSSEHTHVHAIVSELAVPQSPHIPVPLRTLFHDPVHPSEAGHRALGAALAQTLAPLVKGESLTARPREAPTAKAPH